MNCIAPVRFSVDGVKVTAFRQTPHEWIYGPGATAESRGRRFFETSPHLVGSTRLAPLDESDGHGLEIRKVAISSGLVAHRVIVLFVLF